MYGNYFPYQPYNPMQAQKQELVRVNGLEGARAYQMPANSTTALFDANQDVMYIKSTDGAGFPSIRVFTFAEQIQTNGGGTATPADNTQIQQAFDKINQTLDEIKGMISNGKQSVRQAKQSDPKPAEQ